MAPGRRPRVRVDIGQALNLRAAGVPLRTAAKRISVSVATLQRTLAANYTVTANYTLDAGTLD